MSGSQNESVYMQFLLHMCHNILFCNEITVHEHPILRNVPTSQRPKGVKVKYDYFMKGMRLIQTTAKNNVFFFTYLFSGHVYNL